MSGFLFYSGGVAFCAGLVLATFSLPSLAVLLWLGFMGAAVGVVCGRAGFARAPLPALAILVILIGGTLGYGRLWLSDSLDTPSNLTEQVDTKVELTGLIVREPDVREKTQHLYVRINDETILVYTDRYTPYHYGDTVTVSGKLESPTNFTTDLGRTFNYAGYLEAKGVEHIIRYATVSVSETGGGNWLIRSLLSGKEQFMSKLELAITEPAAGLGEGLLLGVKQALGEDLETAFRDTGIIHIVVLSGYNISLVVIFIMFVFGYLLPFRARLVAGALAIVSFALLVGLSATVLRASLMAVFILIAKATGRTYEVLRGLIVAGLVMLIWNPYLLLYDVGFHLSFVATFGLIMLSPSLKPYLKFMPESFGLREFLAATIATQLAVLPILLYQMGQFSVVAVVVNVLVLPVVPLAMLLTFITGLVGFLSNTVALGFGYLAYWSLMYIILMAERFASLPFASLVVPAFSIWLVPVMYGALGLGWWYFKTRESFNRPYRRWTIVDEAVYREELLKREMGGAQSAQPNESPIFFR